MKKLSLVLLLLFLVESCFANDKKYVEELFFKKIDEVILVINNKALDKEKRNSEIVKLLEPIFDFELMAKLSLGKKWFTLSKEEQSEFVKLYVQRMKKSYSSKLDAYSGQKIEITDIAQPKSNRVILASNLVASDSTFEVVYKFYKPKEQIKAKELWVIYDVEIQGVSILKTDRAQFSEYLQQNSILELMQLLAKNN